MQIAKHFQLLFMQCLFTSLLTISVHSNEIPSWPPKLANYDIWKSGLIEKKENRFTMKYRRGMSVKDRLNNNTNNLSKDEKNHHDDKILQIGLPAPRSAKGKKFFFIYL